MEIQKSSRNYYPLLDGVRGLAILLILIRHCIHSDIYFIEYLKVKCWIGVDIFFALSGFLITSILISDKASKNFFKRFYTRRILRIFPLYYVALLLVFAITLLFNIEENYILVENAVYFLTYTQNIYFAFSEDNPGNLLLFPFWSLAVEEHFYLIWPFVIRFLKPNYILLSCIGIIIGCTLLRYCFAPNINYVSTFTRLDGLAAGSIVAIIHNSNRFSFKLLPMVSIVSFIGLAYILILMPDSLLPFKYTFVGICSACLVAYCIIDSRLKKILNLMFNNIPMKQLGKYSYGLYVLHFPVFIYYFKLTGSYTLTAQLGFFLTLGLIVFVSYRYLELPFLNLKNKLVPYAKN